MRRLHKHLSARSGRFLRLDPRLGGPRQADADALALREYAARVAANIHRKRERSPDYGKVPDQA